MTRARTAGLLELAERYVDLDLRDFLAQHALDDAEPLTVDEHLDLLAIRDEIGRQVSYGRQAAVRRAREAGASWRAITDAVDTDAATAYREFLEWIDGQAALWDDIAAEGRRPLGLSPAERIAARRLAEDDPTARVAGPDRKEAPTPR